jgi:hypothetical protein
MGQTFVPSEVVLPGGWAPSQSGKCFKAILSYAAIQRPHTIRHPDVRITIPIAHWKRRRAGMMLA